LSSSEKPEPHPQPDLIDSVVLPTHIIKAELRLFRIHKSFGRNNQKRGAIYYRRYGLDGNRFNAPDGEYGVFYAGFDSFVAFRETARVYSSTPISRDFLNPNCLSVVYPQRDLILVDLLSQSYNKYSTSMDINAMMKIIHQFNYLVISRSRQIYFTSIASRLHHEKVPKKGAKVSFYKRFQALMWTK
jgi:hypothetical protein